MHELSIARGLVGLVARHAPREATVRRVHVRVGPLHAIEPGAMQWAWQAATVNTDCAGTELQLELLPWELWCQACDRRWQSDDPIEACLCGNQSPQPIGGDGLTLESLQVEEHAVGETPIPVKP